MRETNNKKLIIASIGICEEDLLLHRIDNKGNVNALYKQGEIYCLLVTDDLSDENAGWSDASEDYEEIYREYEKLRQADERVNKTSKYGHFLY